MTLRRDCLYMLDKVDRAAERKAKQVIAYGVLNDQGYWAGIYHDRETAELVVSKGVPSAHEQIVELKGAKK